MTALVGCSDSCNVCNCKPPHRRWAAGMHVHGSALHVQLFNLQMGHTQSTMCNLQTQHTVCKLPCALRNMSQYSV